MHQGVNCPALCLDEKCHFYVDTQQFSSIKWKSVLPDPRSASSFFSHIQSCLLLDIALKWLSSALQFRIFQRVERCQYGQFLLVKQLHCQLSLYYCFFPLLITSCSSISLQQTYSLIYEDPSGPFRRHLYQELFQLYKDLN